MKKPIIETYVYGIAVFGSYNLSTKLFHITEIYWWMMFIPLILFNHYCINYLSQKE